ncbi:IclR family transcriptional regulator [Halomonas sp. V046]|uniref:IclR family transcriptional regulator n=1 Tax=Halomonas sp. V046 TaxID=3459611 RepID=UPI004043FA67
MNERGSVKARRDAGTQTLLRGLALMQCVGRGVSTVKSLAQTLGVPRSTIARTLSSLVAEGYLHHVPYKGYFLGARLIELGERAAEQRPLVDLARPHLEALAAATRDTVHFGILDNGEVLYLDKLPGMRSVEMRSRTGVRMPALATAMGKAMLAKARESSWPDAYEALRRFDARCSDRPALRPLAEVARDLRASRVRGWTYDWEENEVGIRCVAAAVHDHAGRAVAAVSVTSVISFLSEPRMHELGPVVKSAAEHISRALGRCREE